MKILEFVKQGQMWNDFQSSGKQYYINRIVSIIDTDIGPGVCLKTAFVWLRARLFQM